MGSFGVETGNYTVQVADNVWTPEQVATWVSEFGWGIATDIHFSVVSGGSLTVDISDLVNGTDLARYALEAWSLEPGAT